MKEFEKGVSKNVYDPKCVAELKDLIEKYPFNYMRSLRSKGFMGRCPDRTELLNYVLSATAHMCDDDFEYTLKTRVFWVVNGISSWDDERVCCQVCGKPIKHWNLIDKNDGYKKTCSKVCDRKMFSVTNKAHMKEKYGVENAFQLPEVLESFKERKDERMQHRRETRMKNYGDPNFNNSKQASQKKIEKYGSVWNLDECKKTWKDKYGVENPMQNSAVRQKQQCAAYMFNGRKFDSSWEVFYYFWLKEKGVSFIYQPEEPQLWYVKEDGSKHRYYPDFLLVDSNQLVELKGDNAFDQDGNPIKNGRLSWKEKYQCMLDNHVVILKEEDIQLYKQFFEERFGKDYVSSLKFIDASDDLC